MSRALGMGRTLFAVALIGGLLAGCGGDGMEDLRAFVAQEKAKPGGRIEPLPEIKPYESFLYGAQELRAPFTPAPLAQATPGAQPSGGGSGVRPDTDRPREALEAYPLDTLRMVGILERGGERAALIRIQDGTIHRIKTGNYIGQNHGKIIGISEDKVELTEIVADSSGGWLERPATVALSE
jgi:type IV pilus assembly protein PilP